MDKEKRKKLLIEMMQEDEKYGMYEQSESPLIGEQKQFTIHELRAAYYAGVNKR